MKRNPPDKTEEIEEEDDYVNDPVRTVDEVAAPPDQRLLFFPRSLPPIAVCWLILLLVMGLRVYFTSVISEHNKLNDKLSVDNDNLRMERTNLTVELSNLTTRNQELENQKNNLTQQIQNMEKNWNEGNISRAQWSIDAYCRKDRDDPVRTCKACRKGWLLNLNSCYIYIDVKPDDQMTWEEALENCRVKSSDLTVAHTEEEKDIINDYSRGTGFWIGLKVEEGIWKWIDGTELSNSSWIGEPTEGHCAVSVQGKPWSSALCGDRKQWICVQEALSV